MLDGPRGLRPGSCGGPGHTPDLSRKGCGTTVLLVIAAMILILL